ncbi:hypothetical protein KL911_001676 [Ogataea haglerorum]|uniref:uncharacterized protein n=1 Tax=Ogataea haglerorum TaxID=1937702 RepID=UPI001C8968F2|nr:uncharacterized protein KL911_001676 [Ogataea haglerorum]KAG7755619.1 hypothetical protein KL911_001676 [Ogataea haglerorum]
MEQQLLGCYSRHAKTLLFHILHLLGSPKKILIPSKKSNHLNITIRTKEYTMGFGAQSLNSVHIQANRSQTSSHYDVAIGNALDTGLVIWVSYSLLGWLFMPPCAQKNMTRFIPLPEGYVKKYCEESLGFAVDASYLVFPNQIAAGSLLLRHQVIAVRVNACV